jgi:hypothetical protein
MVAIKVVLVGGNRNCEAGAGQSQHIFFDRAMSV